MGYDFCPVNYIYYLFESLLVQTQETRMTWSIFPLSITQINNAITIIFYSVKDFLRGRNGGICCLRLTSA